MVVNETGGWVHWDQHEAAMKEYEEALNWIAAACEEDIPACTRIQRIQEVLRRTLEEGSNG